MFQAGIPLIHSTAFLYIFVCAFLFPYSSSFLSALPLPVCWLPVVQQLPPSSSSFPPSLPPRPPFRLVSLLLAMHPSSLLPPCSLIPPSPSLFGCHLFSYVRGMGGEWLWCLGAIRLTRRHSLALPRVLCSVVAISCLVRENDWTWGTDGCTQGFQWSYPQVRKVVWLYSF